MVPVRRIDNKEELTACRKLQSVAFVNSLDTAELEKNVAAKSETDAPYIGFFNEEGILTACMELPEFTMRYEGGWVRMVGLGGVASLPEYRFGGAIRQIVETAFRQMRENGAVFSTLYPFSHPYYRQFGYELCHLLPEYEIPIEALSKFRCTSKVRMLGPDDPLDGLQTVFDAHFLRCNLAVRREDRHWREQIGKDPYKERRYTYLLEDENGPSAYLVLAAKETGEDERLAHVYEMAFVRPQGLSDLLGFLYRLSAQYQKTRLSLPEGIPLPALLDESYRVKARYDNQPMARLIHLQRALELKRHFEGAVYTLQVRDNVLAGNDGFFSVRCEGGVVSVEREQEMETADLEIDVRTLTQLLLGFLSMDEALYKQDVQVNANLETLRGVFVKRPVFLTDHF